MDPLPSAGEKAIVDDEAAATSRPHATTPWNGSLLVMRAVNSLSNAMRVVHMDEDPSDNSHKEADISIPMKGSGAVPVILHHSCSGQHICSWETELRGVVNGEPCMLEAGSLNLQQFPVFAPTSGGDSWKVGGQQLRLLFQMLVASLSGCQIDLWVRDDHVHAKPIHALALSDSDEAMELIKTLVAARPTLLSQQHEPPIFTGENCLHVLIVNGRERVLCELIDIVEKGMTKTEVTAAHTCTTVAQASSAALQPG